MAMAMGVASMAVTAPRNPSLVCRAAASNRGEKQGFLDWFRDALDKDSLRETDELLRRTDLEDDKPSNGKAAPASKKSAAPKKTGFNFFGKK